MLPGHAPYTLQKSSRTGDSVLNESSLGGRWLQPHQPKIKTILFKILFYNCMLTNIFVSIVSQRIKPKHFYRRQLICRLALYFAYWFFVHEDGLGKGRGGPASFFSLKQLQNLQTTTVYYL